VNRQRIVFCGTPRFAVPSLNRLLADADFEILAVITQPDRARGRGQEVSPSPVKEAAVAANLPVHQPEKIRAPEAEALLRDLAPDVIVIIAYGQIIPARLLDIPRLGWINLHASLLPKYRGAAPIHWAIANGESQTGVTTMRIDAGMDTGDILLREETPIGADETSPELAARLAELGAPLMVRTLRGLAEGSIAPEAQDSRKATVAPILKREDGQIDWGRPAQEIYNRMRGFRPWPGAYSTFRGQTCHIWGKPASNHQAGAAAGALFADGEGLRVACGAGTSLRLARVKVEGRKEVSAQEFARGARIVAGERFISE
jgi:methionyl-tRNA formyltransferase